MATISEALATAIKYHQAGRLQAAAQIYRLILQAEPNHADAIHLLGVIAQQAGNQEVAVEYIGRAIELKGDAAVFHHNLGEAYRAMGRTPEAVACYRRALELKPDYAEAYNNMGNALEEIGNFRSAEDCFRAALQHNSRFVAAHYNLAELLGGKLPEKDLAVQRRLLEEPEMSDAQRLLLHFGLAQVLDARGEYAAAAEHLDRGNSLQLSEWHKCGRSYNPKKHALFITRMIGVCTADFFERVRGFGLESELPVFVVGLPRSGTTLIEQILASHNQVFGAGEIKFIPNIMDSLAGQGADFSEGLRGLNQQTARRLASRHLEKLRALNGAALRIVDKMPENYLHLGLLASLFPRAKVIHCRRDLRDVALSCWITRLREIRWANDQGHIVSRFHEYQRIMEHWRKVLPMPLLEVDYEETVADLEGVARKLVAWCGLAWEPACLEFQQAKRPVRTASAVQVRQPVYRTSVGRWKHYEHALASLFAELDRVVVHNSGSR
jgi:tetratricopeptide (TPR) repeat protein